MRLSQIRDFLAVADEGSIRAAARSLRLTQPALTKSLRQLEAELGAVLITRSVRGVVPTALGQAFLTRARSIDGDLRRAREEIAQLRGSREGTLSIGASTAPAIGVMPRAVVKLRESWPDAKIRVSDTSFPHVLADLPHGLALQSKTVAIARVVVARRPTKAEHGVFLGGLVAAASEQVRVLVRL